MRPCSCKGYLDCLGPLLILSWEEWPDIRLYIFGFCFIVHIWFYGRVSGQILVCTDLKDMLSVLIHMRWFYERVSGPILDCRTEKDVLSVFGHIANDFCEDGWSDIRLCCSK